VVTSRLWLALLAATACKPSLDETVSVVSAPVVLAVRSDPAEVDPLARSQTGPTVNVSYTALFVDASGRIASAPIQWAFCNARKPLAELGPVNTECLETTGSWFDPIGVGPQVTGTIPLIACKQFGPDVPMVPLGQTPGRPVDPDPTGGYYQPVRLIAPEQGADLVGIGETRLACGLAEASPDVLEQFQVRYHANINPAVESLGVVGGTSWETDDKATNPVHVGERLTLRAAWAACPSKDVCNDGVCGPDETAMNCPDDCMETNTNTKVIGCTGAERFVALELSTQALAVERESMGVAWFATGGSFDSDRTGRDSTDPTATSDNGWRAPSASGPVHLWVVLRDNRGGVGWAEYALDVK
jgi:hypothetical protein